jgi:3-oxoacyl-[acyl-carrier protein] reductase
LKKTALITGAARGIGLGIAKCLSSIGYDIILNDIIDNYLAEKSINKIKKSGTEVLYCKADISKPEQRETMLNEIYKKFSIINILVNNAGIAPESRLDITMAREEDFEKTIKVNLQGPFFLTQAVANNMIKHRVKNKDDFFCIINISSVASHNAISARGEYCISKAGVSMATKLWAARLAGENIMVFEIQPGIIETEMTKNLTQMHNKMIAQGLIPQNKRGTPDDVGKAVASLVQGGFNYSTGQIIRVDGGLLIQRM